MDGGKCGDRYYNIAIGRPGWDWRVRRGADHLISHRPSERLDCEFDVMLSEKGFQLSWYLWKVLGMFLLYLLDFKTMIRGWASLRVRLGSGPSKLGQHKVPSNDQRSTTFLALRFFDSMLILPNASTRPARNTPKPTSFGKTLLRVLHDVQTTQAP